MFAAIDFDEGTLDDPRDDDEEWVDELAVPLTLAGPPLLAVHVARCDTPKDGVERCGVWAARVAAE